MSAVDDAAAVAADAERPLPEFERHDGVVLDAGADVLGLRAHLLHQPGALDRLGEARIVLDVGGDHQLPARLETRQHQRLQQRARRIDGGGVAGRSRTDDDHALMRAMGRTQDEAPFFAAFAVDASHAPTVVFPPLYGERRCATTARAFELARASRDRETSMLVLRTSGASPFARKTLIVASLLGLEDRIEVRTADTNDPDNSLRRENPLGKIPALILESGETIFDSAVIVEYLDWLAGGGQAIPAEPQGALQVPDPAGAGGRRRRGRGAAALRDRLARALAALGEVARLPGRQDRPRAPRLRGRAARGAQRRRHSRARLRPRLSRPALRRPMAGGAPQLVAWLDVFAEATPSFEATRVGS